MVVIGHVRESFDSMVSIALSLRNDLEEKFRLEETLSMSLKVRDIHARVGTSPSLSPSLPHL